MGTPPLMAIREKCLDRCCGSSNEVKLCTVAHCALYPFRFGRNPNRQREPTPAQLEALKNGRVPFVTVDKVGISGK